MSALELVAFAAGTAAVALGIGWFQARILVRRLQRAHTSALQVHESRAVTDARCIETLNRAIGDAHRELQLREIRLTGKPAWVDGFVDPAAAKDGEPWGSTSARFALDGGVIVGAIVCEGENRWRSYGRMPGGVTDAGSVQWSLVTNPPARAQQEAERIMASLAKHEREHAARREVL